MTFTYDISKYTPVQLCAIPMVLLVLSLILLGFTEGAFHTGFVMTTKTIGAIFAIWSVSTFAQITIISEMSAVLLISLLFDLLNTWATNAGIRKWHAEGGRLSSLFEHKKKGRKV